MTDADMPACADDRADQHLKVLVERLVREGRSEWEIEEAVVRASGDPPPRRTGWRWLSRLAQA